MDDVASHGTSGWWIRLYTERAWQRRAFGVGMIASVALHGALFLGWGRERAVIEPPGRPAESKLVVLSPPEREEAERPAVEVALPPPAEPIARPAEPVLAEGPGEIDPPAEPTWIPHEVPPRLLNAAEVRSSLAAFQLDGTARAGTDHVAILWLFVDRAGEVRRLQLRRSSGSTGLDTLVQRAVRVMEFSPALNQGRPVGVWISQPVRFSFRGDAVAESPGGGGTR